MHPHDRSNIPLLRPRESANDLEAVRTWHEAVSDALLFDVPHSLFALWLYPHPGQAVLVAPEELAQDNLSVPLPSPLLDPAHLRVMEEIVRDAGYRSTLCRGIRYAGADIGLVLFGDFEPERYGPREIEVIEAAIEAMSPVLSRIVRRWPVEGDGRPAGRAGGGPDAEAQAEGSTHQSGHASAAPGTEAPVLDGSAYRALLGSLAQALGGASTPRDFTLALSFAIQAHLPHDHIDLLIPDTGAERWYRLSEHGFGALWADPSLIVSRETLDIPGLFGEGTRVLLDDSEEKFGGPLQLGVVVRGEGSGARSLIGVALRVVERTVGYLLLGSPGPAFYAESDFELLEQVGGLIAARVDAWVLAWQEQVLRGQLGVVRHVPLHLSRIAEVLATTTLAGEGTRIFVEQAMALLPLKALEFAVRLTDDTRVVVVTSGNTTPLADLPQLPIEGTGVARVVRGEIPYLLTEDDGTTQRVSVLVVPLRVGGGVFGAMAMTAPSEAPFTRTDMAVAQQLADLIAPHLDVARRGALLPPTFIPGWKRARF